MGSAFSAAITALAHVAVATVASGASADLVTDADAVTWVAPSACPDEDTVRADVARLGGSARAGARARVQVEAPGAGEPRWTASVILDDNGAQRTRTLSARSCGALAEATALVVAIALRSGSEPDPPARDEALPASLPSPSVPRAPERAPPARASSHVEAFALEAFALGAAFHHISGALPSAAPGGAAWIAWLSGRARVEIGVYGTSAQTAGAPGAAYGARLQIVGAQARACWNLISSTRVAIGPCAGLDVVRISSSGVGLTWSVDGTTWGPAGAFGVRAALAPIRACALSVAFDAIAPSARPRFVVEGAPNTIVHRPAAVWGQLIVGGEVRF
jgi:hypothetical protein